MDLIKNLFSIIVKATGNQKPQIKKRLSKLIAEYGFLVSGLTFTLKVVRWEPKKLLDDLQKSICAEKGVEEIKKELDEILNQLSNPITIFIDDIDRLSKDEVYTLFKTIKLIANFKKVIYVLSFDDEMVAKSIKDKFADGTDSDGFSYLEKIIDIPLRLPNISYIGLENYFKSLLKESLEPDEEFYDLLHIITHNLIQTPRDCKRITNSANFLYSSLQQKLSFNDILLLETLRLKSNELFWIVKNYHKSILQKEPLLFFTGLDSKELLAKVAKINPDGVPSQLLRDHVRTSIWYIFFVKLFRLDIISELHIASVRDNGIEYDRTNPNRFFSITNPYLVDEKSINRIYNPNRLIDYFQFVNDFSDEELFNRMSIENVTFP